MRGWTLLSGSMIYKEDNSVSIGMTSQIGDKTMLAVLLLLKLHG
jgi:hypothetical protein